MKKKRPVRIVNGDNLLTETKEVTGKRKVYQSKIDQCLNCKKPASECKGNCTRVIYDD